MKKFFFAGEMNDLKAAPEQWKADKYDWSKADTEAMDNDSAFRCILELRSRIERLEAQASNYLAIPDSSTPPPVATDEELRDIWDCAFDLRAIYNLGVAHEAARWREVAEPAPVAEGLVASVAYSITEDSDGPINCKNEARAAILELATWLREQGCDEAANLLEQEAWR